MSVRDQNGDAVIHAIARRPVDQMKFDCLMAILIHTPSHDLDINLTTVDENTALHLAVKVQFSFRAHVFGSET